MDKHQAAAISQMADLLHDYNRGVLAMLGMENMAAEHEMICGMVKILIQKRDDLAPVSDSLFDAIELTPEQQKIQDRIDWNVARRNAAWAPIQAMIDEARAQLCADDPLGLSQHA